MNKYKIIFFLLALNSFIVSQTNYFVNKDGTGNFKSIAELNSANLVSGDIVSFKSGQQFADAILICKSGVRYNTYGGTEPAIIGNPTITGFNPTIKVNNSHVTLDNLKIFGYKDANAVITYAENYLTITNCEIIGGEYAHRQHAYAIKQINEFKGTGHKFLKNKIHDTGHGIYIYRPFEFEIGYNEMYDFYITTGRMDYGGYAIGGERRAETDTWDVAYTFIIHHNNIYNYEYTAFALGFTRTIFEYNEIHHNLDERIYRGGVKHGGLGKLYDNFGTTNDGTIGGVGLIFRYNYVHDIIRRGEANYTYGKQTQELVENKSFNIVSTNNGYNKAVYEYSVDQNPDYNNYGLHYGDGVEENPDGGLSGLGYANYWIHNNIFDNCSNRIAGRANNYLEPFREDLGSYFINNTIINCGYLGYVTDHQLMITEYKSQSPHTVVNNIIDFTNPNSLAAGRWREDQLFLDNNIYLNQGGVFIPTEQKPYPNPGEKWATWYENGIKVQKASGTGEQYFTDPNWNNVNEKFFSPNIGPSGAYLPDARIIENGNAHNKGMNYNTIGDSYTVLGQKHKLGEDPTGRSFAYDILGNYRTTNDIGALGSVSPGTPQPPNVSTPVITNQPEDKFVNEGDNITITVSATCDDPIGFQWWKSQYVNDSESKIIDNEKYSGATTNSLKIKTISSTDTTMKYICEIYNTKDHKNKWVNSRIVSIKITQSIPNNPIFQGEFRVFLEAPFSNGILSTKLNSTVAIPNNHPYSIEPWNVKNDVIINKFSENYVDWILIELRDNLTTTKYSKPAILTSQGKVINPDGSDFSFKNIESGDFYLVVKHRNHLSIMSSNKINIKNNEPINYNFTDSQSKAYGTNSMVDLGGGNYGMFAGDGDANGVINNLDFGTVANFIPSKGYAQGDLDMNGIINVLDYSLINKNILKHSQLP